MATAAGANLCAALVVGMSLFGLWELQQAQWCGSGCFCSASTGTVGVMQRRPAEEKHLWTKPVKGTESKEFQAFYFPDGKWIVKDKQSDPNCPASVGFSRLFLFPRMHCVFAVMVNSDLARDDADYHSAAQMLRSQLRPRQAASLTLLGIYKKISAAVCERPGGPRLWTMSSIVSPSPQSDSEITDVQMLASWWKWDAASPRPALRKPRTFVWCFVWKQTKMPKPGFTLKWQFYRAETRGRFPELQGAKMNHNLTLEIESTDEHINRW